VDALACARCGKPYEQRRPWQIYCSPPCRMAAYADTRYSRERDRRRAIEAVLEDVEVFLEQHPVVYGSSKLLERVRTILARAPQG